MDVGWQISVGDLFEMLRPAAFLLSLLLSTWVLCAALNERDERDERRWPLYAVALWTLFTLFLPAITFPLYLAVRLITRHNEQAASTGQEATEEKAASEAVVDDEPSGGEQAADGDATAGDARVPLPQRMRAGLRRLALPLLYLALVFACGALYFYRDYASADAHLARAGRAKLYGRSERAIDEYRASLVREDDPHTRKLLGLELAAAERWEEALAQFLAAEGAGEPDASLPFHIAGALAALGRFDEAVAYYQRFVGGPACEQPARSEEDAACAKACERLRIVGRAESRCFKD